MIRLIEGVSLNGFTLIVPCVSVGNISQLSADLLITTLNMQRAGYLWHPGFIPIVGSNPFEIWRGNYRNRANNDVQDRSLHTAAELYYSQDKLLAVLQIRSPLVRRLRGAFFQELVKFIKISNILKVVLVTSGYAHILHGQHENLYLGNIGFHYIASDDVVVSLQETFNRLKWIAFDKHDIEENTTERNQEFYSGLYGVDNTEQNTFIDRTNHESKIPGYAKELFDLMNKEKLSVVLALKYCSEGDNQQDAIRATVCLDNWMDILPKDKTGKPSLSFPTSWKLLYGNFNPEQMY